MTRDSGGELSQVSKDTWTSNQSGLMARAGDGMRDIEMPGREEANCLEKEIEGSNSSGPFRDSPTFGKKTNTHTHFANPCLHRLCLT